MYGSGLRWLKALRLRVQEVRFSHCHLMIRHAKTLQQSPATHWLESGQDIRTIPELRG